MKKLLKEIHEQPEHIRAVFMWVSVVIVLAIVLTFTLPPVIRDTIALVNPDNEFVRDSETENNGNAFTNALSEAGASIGALWDAAFEGDNDEQTQQPAANQNEIQLDVPPGLMIRL